jgi:hypothetical protein
MPVMGESSMLPSLRIFLRIGMQDTDWRSPWQKGAAQRAGTLAKGRME